jgi:hypothetical protein
MQPKSSGALPTRCGVTPHARASRPAHAPDRLSKKQAASARLYVLQDTKLGVRAGTELPREGDISRFVADDDLLSLVPGGEDFLFINGRVGGREIEQAAREAKVPDLPRADVSIAEPAPVATEQPSRASRAVAAPRGAPCSRALNGSFPVLDGDVLSVLREAVAGDDHFLVRDEGEYVAFDYKGDFSVRSGLRL